MSLQIRTARPEDAARLLEIYGPYVTDTAITFEYEIPSLEEFRGRIAHTLEKYPWLVAEESSGQDDPGAPSRILGYAYLSSFHARAAYGWCAETSIYLDREVRGKGIGRKLYGELERIAKLQGLLNLNACIAFAPGGEDPHLTNASVAFHEHLGYHLNGHFHRCGYKFHTWYDMVWMEKTIGEHKETPEAVIPFPELTDI